MEAITTDEQYWSAFASYIGLALDKGEVVVMGEHFFQTYYAPQGLDRHKLPGWMQLTAGTKSCFIARPPETLNEIVDESRFIDTSTRQAGPTYKPIQS